MSARAVPAWMGDAATGLGLSALGVVFVVLSLPIPRGEVRSPGPGFMPLVMGVALTILGAASAARAWRARSAAAVPLGNRKVLLCVVALTASALFLQPLGFLPTTALFLAVLFRALGPASWWKALTVAAASAIGLWLLFDRVLGVLLPAGVLPL